MKTQNYKNTEPSAADFSKVDSLIEIADESKQNKPGTTLEICREAMSYAEKIAYTEGLAKLNLIAGICCRSLSDFDSALKYYNKSLKIYKESSDVKGESKVLNSIANIYYSTSDYKNALGYYKKTLDTIENTGDVKYKATVLANIALTHQAQENIGEAIECSLSSLKIYEELEAAIPHSLLNNIGIIYQGIGDYNTSLVYFSKALKIEEETNNIADQSFTLGNMGVSYSYLDDNINAVTYLNKALILLKETGNVQAMSTVYTYLGNAYKKLASYSLAIPRYYRSLKYSREINDSSSVAHILNEFGELYFLIKDYKTAKEYFDESLQIAIDLNDDIHQVKNYTSLAILYSVFKDMDKISGFITKAIELAEPRKAYKEIGNLYRIYSAACKKGGDYTNSMLYHDKFNDFEKKSLHYENEKRISAMANNMGIKGEHTNGMSMDSYMAKTNGQYAGQKAL